MVRSLADRTSFNPGAHAAEVLEVPELHERVARRGGQDALRGAERHGPDAWKRNHSKSRLAILNCFLPNMAKVILFFFLKTFRTFTDLQQLSGIFRNSDKKFLPISAKKKRFSFFLF